MSGLVKDNVFGSSGTVAAAAGGLSWDTAVVTGSTVTVEAANGYFINTTSNTCTITLPSSAEAGDQITLIDYARTWGDNEIIIDSNGLNFQGDPDGYIVDYDKEGQAINLVYSDSTNGWIPTSDIAVEDEPTAIQKAIYAYGSTGSVVSMSNLVSNTGVVGSDVSGVGSARLGPSATTYGGDKAIYAYGDTGSVVSMSNLVSNTGVVGSDVSGVGTVRKFLTATGYGVGLAVFAYGILADNAGVTSLKNLVNSSGVVADDVTGVGSARYAPAAARYGSSGQALFGFGANLDSPYNLSMTNLVSNVGVIGTDVSGVGTDRAYLGCTGYGDDKAIFAYGETATEVSMSNLVSNSGVVASDVTGVGTARISAEAARYGSDKGIFAYGNNGGVTAVSNLVSNSGVIASDVTGVGTARKHAAAAGYSTA